MECKRTACLFFSSSVSQCRFQLVDQQHASKPNDRSPRQSSTRLAEESSSKLLYMKLMVLFANLNLGVLCPPTIKLVATHISRRV
jgi:hypothetical protein